MQQLVQTFYISVFYFSVNLNFSTNNTAPFLMPYIKMAKNSKQKILNSKFQIKKCTK